jgi:hypothetical protein
MALRALPADQRPQQQGGRERDDDERLGQVGVVLGLDTLVVGQLDVVGDIVIEALANPLGKRLHVAHQQGLRLFQLAGGRQLDQLAGRRQALLAGSGGLDEEPLILLVGKQFRVLGAELVSLFFRRAEGSVTGHGHAPLAFRRSVEQPGLLDRLVVELDDLVERDDRGDGVVGEHQHVLLDRKQLPEREPPDQEGQQDQREKAERDAAGNGHGVHGGRIGNGHGAHGGKWVW